MKPNIMLSCSFYFVSLMTTHDGQCLLTTVTLQADFFREATALREGEPPVAPVPIQPIAKTGAPLSFNKTRLSALPTYPASRSRASSCGPTFSKKGCWFFERNRANKSSMSGEVGPVSYIFYERKKQSL